jgi:hypothetical protein
MGPWVLPTRVPRGGQGRGSFLEDYFCFSFHDSSAAFISWVLYREHIYALLISIVMNNVHACKWPQIQSTNWLALLPYTLRGNEVGVRGE